MVEEKHRTYVFDRGKKKENFEIMAILKFKIGCQSIYALIELSFYLILKRTLRRMNLIKLQEDNYVQHFIFTDTNKWYFSSSLQQVVYTMLSSVQSSIEEN